MEMGELLRTGVAEIAVARGVSEHFHASGFASNLVYGTLDQDRQPSQAFRTLFLQELIKRGVLAPSFVVSYTHTKREVQRTLEAVDGALRVYRKALENGVSNYLVGRPSDVVFRATNRFVAPPADVPALVPQLDLRTRQKKLHSAER